MFTAEHIGQNVGIVIDGILFTAPRIAAVVESSFEVYLGGNEQEAQEIALILRSGELSVSLTWQVAELITDSRQYRQEIELSCGVYPFGHEYITANSLFLSYPSGWSVWEGYYETGLYVGTSESVLGASQENIPAGEAQIYVTFGTYSELLKSVPVSDQERGSIGLSDFLQAILENLPAGTTTQFADQIIVGTRSFTRISIQGQHHEGEIFVSEIDANRVLAVSAAFALGEMSGFEDEIFLIVSSIGVQPGDVQDTLPTPQQHALSIDKATYSTPDGLMQFDLPISWAEPFNAAQPPGYILYTSNVSPLPATADNGVVMVIFNPVVSWIYPASTLSEAYSVAQSHGYYPQNVVVGEKEAIRIEFVRNPGWFTEVRYIIERPAPVGGVIEISLYGVTRDVPLFEPVFQQIVDSIRSTSAQTPTATQTATIFVPPYPSCVPSTLAFNTIETDIKHLVDYGFSLAKADCDAEDGSINYSIVLFGGSLP